MGNGLWKGHIYDNDNPEVAWNEHLLQRFTVCYWDAIHGVVFEFRDGRRAGILLNNDGNSMDLRNNLIIARGGGGNDRVNVRNKWVNVAPGDYIVKVSGNHLVNVHDFLCHKLVFEFASGNIFSFTADNENLSGRPFSYEVEQPFLVTGLDFCRGTHDDRRATLHHLLGIRTWVHLPVVRANAPHFPGYIKNGINFLLLTARRRAELPAEISENILEFLQGYDIHCFCIAAAIPTGRPITRTQAHMDLPSLLLNGNAGR